MHPYRVGRRVALDLSRWVAILFAAFGLSACSVTGTNVTQAISPNLPNTAAPPRTASTTTPAAATTSSGATDAWKAYRNDREGYAVDYPATWNVAERVDPDGADVTTFSAGSDNNGMSVAVIVRNGQPTDQDIPDMPNTRCQRVTIGGLSGTRCFDTIAFSMTTTLVARGQVYILVGSGKRLDRNIYERFLSSLTLKS